MKLSFVKKYYYGDIPEEASGGREEKGEQTFPGKESGLSDKRRNLKEDTDKTEREEAAVSGIEGLGGKTAATGKEVQQKAIATEDGRPTATGTDWPIWEVFIRSRQGLDHKHVGSLHAADAAMAVENARDVYTRRQEGISIWVVESRYIRASNPDEADSMYDPANDKIYRHPTFYNLPDELTHI